MKTLFQLFTIEQFEIYLTKLKITRKIHCIQNHHTYIPAYKDFKGNNHLKLLAAMETEHLKRGFSCIAQNITIFPDGIIALCRPFDQVPAGIKGANDHGICIENVGNFDLGHDWMTQVQSQAIIKVNAVLCKKFSLIPSTTSIIYHHWYDLETGLPAIEHSITKSCPGTNFFSGNTKERAEEHFIPEIKREMAV